MGVYLADRLPNLHLSNILGELHACPIHRSSILFSRPWSNRWLASTPVDPPHVPLLLRSGGLYTLGFRGDARHGCEGRRGRQRRVSSGDGGGLCVRRGAAEDAPADVGETVVRKAGPVEERFPRGHRLRIVAVGVHSRPGGGTQSPA